MRPFVSKMGVVALAAAMLAACSGGRSVIPASGTGTAPNAASPAAAGSHGGTRVLTVGADDVSAAYHVSDFSYHIFPTAAHRTGAPAAVAPDKTKVVYPADLHNFGGPVMKTAAAYNVYINCKGNDQSCWGKPEQFQQGLTNSTLFQLLKQYTKSGDGAYTFGGSQPVSYALYSNYIYDSDLFAILHLAAKTYGVSGYTAVYHLFLPQGLDTCFDGTSVCYSPDNPSTWYFCAYHGSVKFSDVGTITYSVEPYQNVDGCRYQVPKGFDKLQNATDSTLLHETAEAITDPNPNTYKTAAWYNLAYQSEIADLCDYYPMTMKIGGTKYYVQSLYSNKHHGCANGP